MLYCNQEVRSEERELPFGTIHQLCFGKWGQGKKPILLHCFPNTVIQNGMNKFITITYTKSGKPKVAPYGDYDNLYLLLSSQGTSCGRGNGTIMVPRKQLYNFKVIQHGYGAEGIGGKSGHWDLVLILMQDLHSKSIVRIQERGNAREYFLLIDGRRVHTCTRPQILEACKILDMEVPSFSRFDWIKL